MKYFVIYTTDFYFLPLYYGEARSLEEARAIANDFADKFLGQDVHYSFMYGFNTRLEMVNRVYSASQEEYAYLKED